MCRPICAELAGLAKGPRIASVGFHLAASLGVHGRKVRVGHNHFVPELLQASGHPFAFGRRLDQDAGLVTFPEPVVPQNVIRGELVAASFAKRGKLERSGASATARNARAKRRIGLCSAQCTQLSLIPDVRRGTETFAQAAHRE